MWTMVRWLVLRLAAIRWLFKGFGGLALLLPLALLLKGIGLPLLMVMGVLALPVLFVLFLFGLPIFLVLMVGGAVMGLVAFVVTIGVAALKIGLFVVLPAYLLWKAATMLYRWIFKTKTDEPPPASA